MIYNNIIYAYITYDSYARDRVMLRGTSGRAPEVGPKAAAGRGRWESNVDVERILVKYEIQS